jgi:hypothetical protein
MRYRSVGDRNISAYGAVLVITIIASTATLFIVHTISNIDFTYQNEAAALAP